jgi:hypothetical protein
VFVVEEPLGNAPSEAAGAHEMMSPQPSAAIIVRTTTSVFHLELNPSVGVITGRAAWTDMPVIRRRRNRAEAARWSETARRDSAGEVCDVGGSLVVLVEKSRLRVKRFRGGGAFNGCGGDRGLGGG